MRIFRAELTPNPRGSLSAPALTEYYWMPPVSLTCTAVSHVPDQMPVSASTASLLPCGGSRSSPTALREPVVETPCLGDESAGPTDASFLHRPFGKSLPPRTLKRAFLATALVAGIVAALVASNQLLQTGGFSEESTFTEAAVRPLVDESPSKPRGSPRGYASGGDNEEITTYITTITTETNEEEGDGTKSTMMSPTPTRRSKKTTRQRLLSSSRRRERVVSRTFIEYRKRTPPAKDASPRLRLATSGREKKKQAPRHRTRKVKHALQQPQRTTFSGRLQAVIRETNPVSLKEITPGAAVPPRRNGGS